MRDYLARLKARGDLIVIDREVDPVHELAAVAVQLQRKSGKAVLFNKVRGSDMPVAINVYSNHDRLCEIIRCGTGISANGWMNRSTRPPAMPHGSATPGLRNGARAS